MKAGTRRIRQSVLLFATSTTVGTERSSEPATALLAARCESAATAGCALALPSEQVPPRGGQVIWIG